MRLTFKQELPMSENTNVNPYSTQDMWDRLAEYEGTDKKIYALGDGHITVGGGIVINVKDKPILDYGIDYRNYGYTWNPDTQDFDQINHTQDLTPEDAAKLDNLKTRVLNKAEGYTDIFLNNLSEDQLYNLKQSNPGLYAALVSRAWVLPIMSRYADPSFSSGKEKWDTDFTGLRQSVFNYVNNPDDITSKYKMLFFYNSSSEAPSDKFSGGWSRRMGDQRAWITGMQDYRNKAHGSDNTGYFSLYWNPKWGLGKVFEDGTRANYDPETGYVEYKTPEGIILSTDPNSPRYWNKEGANYLSREYFDSDEDWGRMNKAPIQEDDIIVIDGAESVTPIRSWISNNPLMNMGRKLAERLGAIVGRRSHAQQPVVEEVPDETETEEDSPQNGTGVVYQPAARAFQQGGTIENDSNIYEQSSEYSAINPIIIGQGITYSPTVHKTASIAYAPAPIRVDDPEEESISYSPISSVEDETTEPVDYEDEFFTQSTEKSNNITTELLLEHINPHIGTPYLFGGKTWNGSGIDCSGFVKAIYDELGINLQHGSWKQFTEDTVETTIENAEPGDLVFLKGTMVKERGENGLSHVGIYLGTNPDGSIQVAESGGHGVSINTWDITQGWYKSHFVGVRKIKDNLKK